MRDKVNGGLTLLLCRFNNLKYDIDMHPGDVLYVPATVMAKVIRVINPVASTVGIASGGSTDTATLRRGGELAR